MQKKGIYTVRQARKLPEIDLLEELNLPISPIPIEGDEILLFVDTDNRTKRIVHTPKGYAKVVQLPW